METPVIQLPEMENAYGHSPRFAQSQPNAIKTDCQALLMFGAGIGVVAIRAAAGNIAY